MSDETSVGTVRTASGWSMVWGILMLICGILAIALPLASSLGIVILLAWLILFAGIWHLLFAFQSHSIGGFLWKVLLAVLYGFAGIYMLMNPLLGVISLTLVLAVFLLFEGVMEIVLYFNIRNVRNSGWVLLDGIITLILGFLIWGPVAIELRLGDRNPDRHQLDLQRHFPVHAFPDRPAPHSSTVVIAGCTTDRTYHFVIPL